MVNRAFRLIKMRNLLDYFLLVLLLIWTIPYRILLLLLSEKVKLYAAEKIIEKLNIETIAQQPLSENKFSSNSPVSKEKPIKRHYNPLGQGYSAK